MTTNAELSLSDNLASSAMPEQAQTSDVPEVVQTSVPSETTAFSVESIAAEEASSKEEDEGSTSSEDESALGASGEKKKKRRRKKKKPAAAEGELNAAAGEGGSEGDASQKKKKFKKPLVERERPPFGVGDIVFGKVLEITDDVMFVDLSGKAKAIFDLRELLIPEEEVREAKEAAEKERAERALEKAKQAELLAHAQQKESTETQNAETVEGAEGAAALPAGEGQTEEATSSAQAQETETVDAASADAETEEASALEPVLPKIILEPGAQFVGVVRNDGGRGGNVVVTHHPERISRTKPLVQQAFRDKSMVFGIVTGAIKGGVDVDVDGLRAFAPASHMDLRLGADLSTWVGKRLGFYVTQYGKRGRDVVLSRKSIIEGEAKEAREAALSRLEVGQEIEGTVRTVTSFGAFIDLGGIEGLVTLSEMSHNRSDRPSDVFKVGEKKAVKLLKIDEKGKLWLSHKATIADPWLDVSNKYTLGSKHLGKIVRLQPFGVFVELEQGIDGLIHTSDLSLKQIDHPSEIVKEGDELEVIVAHLDSGAHKISLHPAPTGEQASEEPQKVLKDKTVKVSVVNADNQGLYVRILGVTGRSARGFIPPGGTGTPRGTELKKAFPTGKILDAKILEIDPRRGEVKLSLKALAEETERNAFQAYRSQVKREAKFGTFADLLQKKLEKE